MENGIPVWKMVTPLSCHPPSAACAESARVREERQFVNVADRQPVRTVEVGNPARGVDVALIVVCGVERRVAG